MFSPSKVVLALLFSALLTSCRSGHFEAKSLAQVQNDFQVRLISSRNLGGCSEDSVSCRLTEFRLQILGPHQKILQDQDFQIQTEHPDLISVSPNPAHADSLGNIVLLVSFHVHPELPPELLECLFSLTSPFLGTHHFKVEVEPLALESPVRKFEPNESNFKPASLPLDEPFVATPRSFYTQSTREISSQLLEYEVEHRALITHRDGSKLIGRKVFYEIRLNNQADAPLQGAQLTNDQGELPIRFPVTYRPFDHESLIEVKFVARLSEAPSSEKVEWTSRLSFEVDPLRPLVDFSPAPQGASNASRVDEPQRIRIGDNLRFQFEMTAEDYEIDKNLNLTFIPHFKLETPIEIGRYLLAKPSLDWKAMPRTEVRGKIFLIRETSKVEVLAEQVISSSSDSSGEISISLSPKFSEPVFLAEGVTWIFALELPDYPKIDRSFFEFHPSKQLLSRLSKADALQKIGLGIYDHTPATLALPSQSQEQAAFEILFPGVRQVPSGSADFDDRLLSLSNLGEAETLRRILELVFSRNLGPRHAEVYQYDFVDKIDTSELKSHERWTEKVLVEGGSVSAYRDRYRFEIRGESHRCFLAKDIKTAERLSYCIARAAPLQQIETWDYYSPEYPSSHFKPVLIRGLKGSLESVGELRRHVSESKPGVLVQRIFTAAR